MMFWKDGGGTGGGNGRDLSGGPPCGQVRVLVVGDSGQSASWARLVSSFGLVGFNFSAARL